MAEDWQAGDLALCVCSGDFRWNNAFGTKPISGGIYTVLGVTQGKSKQGLLFKEVSDGGNPLGWAARRFRKIRPHTPDAEDEEVIALLNGQPVRETAK